MRSLYRLTFAGIVFMLILMGGSDALLAAESDGGQTITSVDTLLFENFDGPEGPFEQYPLPEWTVIDSGVPEWDETSWSRYHNDPYPQYWNGDLARVLFSGTGAIGDWLITPTIDCSQENAVILNYKQSHSNRTTSDNDTIFVYGSTDGGLNWDRTIFMSTESRGGLNHPDTVEFDISSWAAGSNEVRIAYYFKGYDVLTWYVDEPFVGGDVTDTLLYEDFNGEWGDFGDNPPAGWTIINEVVPDGPNANDWSRWYYSTWPDTVALAYDYFNDQTANEWLITPTLTFSEAAVCSLSYYNSFWDDFLDDSDSAFVLGSTDGGQSWDYLIVAYGAVDDRSTNRGQSWRGFDISSWAQNQDNVKIAFHYIKNDPSYLGWWFFDDLTVTESVVLDDNLSALSIDEPSEFIVVGNDYYPQVTVQSLSTQQQTFDLHFTVLDENQVQVYDYTEEGVIIDSMEIEQVTLSEPFTPQSEGIHLLSAIIENPGDEDPSDDSISVSLESYAHEGTGGPDDFGYYFMDSAEPDGPEYSWIEISQSGTQIEPGSHYFMSGSIPLGFDFEFYGHIYSNIYVNSHGELHLGSRDTWLSTNDCPLPDPSTPHAPLLAVFWDLLYIHYEQGQGVYYQYFDTPNDHFVVEWRAKLDGQRSDSLVFEAILQDNGDIIYQYRHVNDLPGGRGQQATIGMEYDVLPSGISYLCDDDNPANRLYDGLAIKWYIPETSVDGETEGIPIRFYLYQNYPNPFNAKTVISYALPITSDLRIEIYDIMGRVVETLVDGTKPAGMHRIIWDSGDNASGVYFYKINAGDFSEIRKMSVLK